MSIFYLWWFFLSLANSHPIANFLFVCSKPLVVTGFPAPAMAVHQGKGRRLLDLGWFTGYHKCLLQAIFLKHTSGILDAKVLMTQCKSLPIDITTAGE